MNNSKVESETNLYLSTLGDTKGNNIISTASLSGLSSVNKSKNIWGIQCSYVPTVSYTFKGANPDLKGKIFAVRLSQWSRYTEVYNILLTYLSTNN